MISDENSRLGAAVSGSAPADSVAEPMTPRSEVQQRAIFRLWRSKQAFALVLLAVAVVLGAQLRFHRLALNDMNIDEGATWTAAVAPDVHAVIQTEEQLEGEKLWLYGLLLHGWVGAFGDSLFSMRALSAGLGTIAIVLLFGAVREVCLCLADEPAANFADLAGAFAALLFATNATMVLASRLARTYPLVVAAELLQILFFVRAQRYGRLRNYAAIAIFTALMLAANYTAVFLLAAEALWLAALLISKWARGRAGGLAIFRPGFAVLAGPALLAPVLLSGAAMGAVRAVRVGQAIDWIKMQPITWPYTALRDSAGGEGLFWILVALGALGVTRRRPSAALPSVFMILWVAGPLLAVLAVTYLIHPLEVPRYVLIAFTGLFALAALGAASFERASIRATLAAVLTCLALIPTYSAINRPARVAWKAAVALAVQQAAPDERILVAPSYGVYTVRYYLPRERRERAVGLDECGPERLMIFSGWWWLPAEETTRIKACYPRLVGRLRKIEVRSR